MKCWRELKRKNKWEALCFLEAALVSHSLHNVFVWVEPWERTLWTQQKQINQRHYFNCCHCHEEKRMIFCFWTLVLIQMVKAPRHPVLTSTWEEWETPSTFPPPHISGLLKALVFTRLTVWFSGRDEGTESSLLFVILPEERQDFWLSHFLFCHPPFLNSSH